LNDILNEPHLAATGFFKPRIHPSEGRYVEMKPPVRFSDATPEERLHPPLLGENNEAVRREVVHRIAKG
jgi:crotonobetainyl-CoA:carnitine CoA-transferase CaiB-like acyl-CoA transferase